MTKDLFHEFFDPIQEAVFIVSLDGRLLVLNRFTAELVGMAPSLITDRGGPALHVLDMATDPSSRVMSFIRACAANRQPVPGALTLKDQDGRATRFKCLGHRVELPGHDGPAVLVRARPLSETLGNFSVLNKELAIQRRALKNLRQSHEILKSVLNSLEAIVYAADMETYEIIFINEYCRDAMGEITGKICWQTLQEGQTGPCDFCTNKYLLREDGSPGEPYYWEFQNTLNKRWYYIIDRAIQWVDGRIVRLEIATDITKKKETELALKESKERWEHTFNAIGLSITILNTDLEVVQANDGACNMLGIEKDEIMGKKCYELFTSAHSPCPKCPAQKALKHRRPTQGTITNHATNRTYSIHVSPIVDAGGALKGIVHIAEDITEKQILETKLQQAQKMEAIGTLAGGIAHDFNNILMPILGYTEISLKMLSKDDKVAANLGIIKNAALRAKELVQQILTFSRQKEHRKEPVYPQQVTKETIKMMRAILPKTIEIRQEICRDCPKVLVSPTHLQQIVMNLCTNAYQAMLPKGGVLGISLTRIQVPEHDEKVVAGELTPGTYVLLQVSDTGCGIPQEAMGKIFEPYYTTKGQEGGTGLGLAMVHGIIKGYDGYITVYSVPGEGTTFRVYIPIVDEEEGQEGSFQDDHADCDGHGRRIMLVDDEGAILDMLRDGLTELGFSVDTFIDPASACEAFEKGANAYDIVVTDLSMPKMTGLEVIRRIRSCRGETPVILCTGFSELMNRELLHDLHINLFLQKPITPLQLARSINEVLGSTR